MEIGSIIKRCRLLKELTQEDMANALGVTPQAVSRWETNISYPDVAMVPEIAKYLGVSTDKLLGCESIAVDIENVNETLNQSQADSIFDYIPNKSNQKRNVLVVDDAEFMRNILEDMLTRDGHTVIKAKNGQEGLEVLAKEQVDICILDIVMPGMHGIEVLEKVRETYADVEVVMLSAQSTVGNVRKSLELGAKGFVVKPFQPSSILERM